MSRLSSDSKVQVIGKEYARGCRLWTEVSDFFTAASRESDACRKGELLRRRFFWEKQGRK